MQTPDEWTTQQSTNKQIKTVCGLCGGQDHKTNRSKKCKFHQNYIERQKKKHDKAHLNESSETNGEGIIVKISGGDTFSGVGRSMSSGTKNIDRHADQELDGNKKM